MYKEHFGFRVLPFSKTANAEIFYSNPVFQEALASLQHAIEVGNGIIIVTGENGTGKTTLVRKFLSDMGSSLRPVHAVTTNVPFFDMLRSALNDLGVVHRSADNLETIELFNNYVAHNERNGATTGLFLDQAHGMDDEGFEDLRGLLSFAENQPSLPRIFLIGEPGLMDKFDRPEQRQLKQRAGLHCRLVPLIAGEVGRYIEFRLRSAGYESAGLFDPSAVAAVARYSQGIPRLVNNICDNALLEAYRRSRGLVDSTIIEDVARNLRLEGPEPAAQVAEDKGAIGGESSSPDWQIETVWSSLQGKDEPAALNVIEPGQREGLNRKAAGALLGLMTLGLAGAAMHFGTAGSDKLDGESSNGSAAMSTSSATESASSLEARPAQRWASRDGITGDRGTVIFDDGNTRLGAVSGSVIPPSVELSKPAPAANLKTSNAGASRPDASRQNKSPDAEPDTKKLPVEIKIHAALRNRAIEGVSVTLVNQIAILRGQVASLRQKAMAEHAALGVREVARVKNLIKIGP